MKCSRSRSYKIKVRLGIAVACSSKESLGLTIVVGWAICKHEPFACEIRRCRWKWICGSGSSRYLSVSSLRAYSWTSFSETTRSCLVSFGILKTLPRTIFKESRMALQRNRDRKNSSRSYSRSKVLAQWLPTRCALYKKSSILVQERRQKRSLDSRTSLIW